MYKTAVRASMRLSSSVIDLMNLPIVEFMELVEEIVAVDEERREKRR